MKKVQVHHQRLLKARKQMEFSTDNKEIAILSNYIRLQEEKITFNGHSLQEVQHNPALGQKQTDPLNMIIGFGTMQLMKVVMKGRSNVLLVLPFDLNPPFSQAIHIGMGNEHVYKNSEVGRVFLNFTIGFVLNKIVKKVVFGKVAKIPMTRMMELQQLKTQQAEAIELVNLENYENLVKDYPDIKETPKPQEDTM